MTGKIATPPGASRVQMGLINTGGTDEDYASGWFYFTASNNPQIWVVQDPVTNKIIGIWHSDDPPEVETDNPFKVIPIQYFDKNNNPYGVISYIEIPSFLDEFKETLEMGIKEIRKRYKLREKFPRPDKLPKRIRFCKLQKI